MTSLNWGCVTQSKKKMSYMSKHNRCWRHCSKSRHPELTPILKCHLLEQTIHPSNSFGNACAAHFDFARCMMVILSSFLIWCTTPTWKILVICSAVQHKYLELPTFVGARSIALVTKVKLNLTTKFGACRNNNKNCRLTNELFKICKN